jgi:hypothetical protein
MPALRITHGRLRPDAGGARRGSAAITSQGAVAAVAVASGVTERGDREQATRVHELSCQPEEWDGGERGNGPIGSIRPPQPGHT